MATGITVIKKFTYRGDAEEEWSNKYHFTGSDPATTADWLALFNALVLIEKTIYPATHVVVRGYGYTSDASTASAVWSRDLEASGGTVPGTLTIAATNAVLPGDTAIWARWKTDRLSVKGKPIFLRKYYHGAVQETLLSDSIVKAAQTTALASFAAKMWDGTFLDARHLRAPGRSSETIVGASTSQYPTIRTLKRRGKRPVPA